MSGGSVVTANYSTAGTYVLNGFKAVTVYMCSVYAENSAGIGPPDSLTVTTREDGKVFTAMSWTIVHVWKLFNPVY